MSRIAFSIDNVHIDPPGLAIESHAQACTNIDAVVTITVGEAQVFREDINFVEFMWCLERWRKDGYAGDFSFDSSDFEETGLVRFRRHGDGYVFASCWLDAPHDAVLGRAIVESFVDDFVTEAGRAVSQQLNIDLHALKP